MNARNRTQGSVHSNVGFMNNNQYRTYLENGLGIKLSDTEQVAHIIAASNGYETAETAETVFCL